jgi:hypothetical protein
MRRLREVCLFSALSWTAVAAAQGYTPEVYRDDALVISAGIEGASGRLLYFGDLLTLALTVEYDPAAVSIRDLDEDIFLAAWPASGPFALADWEGRREETTDAGWRRQGATYRFQVVGCPDEQPTCPGERHYLLPQLTLAYQAMHAGDQTVMATVKFHPWPASLTLTTGLKKDEEGQLLPFETYFPTGGYPEPLAVTGHSGRAWLLAAAALIAFTGGLLMWPFRSRAQKEASAEIPRWRRILQELEAGEADEDAHYVDALRRCLVWYCNDELQVDPFLWLDLAELGEGDEVDEEHGELRSLFFELLHSPTGRNAELRTQLVKLIAQGANA